VVTDYAMPGLNGVDLLRAVRRQWPDIARVLLTGQADVSVAARAVNEGQLMRLFTKPWQAAEVRAALVELVHQHHARLHARAPACATSSDESLLAPLTPREREVLGQVVKGLTNRQIAASLHVSPATARNHVEHILRKLDVIDRTQAAVKALDLGLVPR
jgi:DNA-binding NarL/FixJ family response regulator